MYRLKDYRYDLPQDLIAQSPSARRDASRLLCLNRGDGRIAHRVFADLPALLDPSDLLVINDTEVVPARLYGRKASGGKVEILILDPHDGRAAHAREVTRNCMLKAAKRPKPGTRIFFDQGLTAEVVDSREAVHTLRFSSPEPFESILYRIGRMPLPPYIRRNGDGEPGTAAEGGGTPDDRTHYQTVYAARKGAVAAPTAGLHFTPELLARIRERGVTVAAVTLHVGYGTFVPVRVDDIREHRMHHEAFTIPEKTAEAVNLARSEGRRVVAVGTTSVRTLEYAAGPDGRIAPGSGHCDLFIYPGYRFRAVDAVITNFHLPESTLIMLVSAFAGRENVLSAYREAVARGYRFFSYGDAMLIG
ncbi:MULTISPECIES: tRNA preQ1(34) S-adenosylmethionine ribosyltransferase-isomerase QueA [Desulfococcus]|uniref:S-adenosylmethionine:tRNA ribosyltransferase-isomerase n=1 Tax=Desulfococcus multivorans DSM 2059 TaxID=1121405 RepID=S7VD70_DESML|nr:tRNA preQ1(34) S-adenosylmethionine ribosyltransferase-isomerase QueA [Desulfococcus multivorans]AOY60254.1 QueA: S-adenosylmethionine:tRNA ribosyltransferase-isomerase [Desulfococcus multivorans]AQV02366.1 tRNA preQ1(34) S-adenosylmethionine ribosyltransferase-isomerase QueA [Desulfococcus multivorans]EPR44644.1 S-adenosylmethionine:tRNA ribosyltransferase-isomerase [Desulfococcus multivorans DSM 2059]SKA07773.1 S-adenosylmethionine--tRNA ribosyltransferase-isomerase [Desulfococcus multivor